jgi:hypothetical protein
VTGDVWRCSACSGKLVEYGAPPGTATLDARMRNGTHLRSTGGCGAKAVTWQLISGTSLKREGMQAATTSSEPSGWVQRFDTELERRAQSGVTFTSEDVTHAVGQPPSSGAVGARINAAARRGLIEHVGYTRATRANQHGAELRTWRGVKR